MRLLIWFLSTDIFSLILTGRNIWIRQENCLDLTGRIFLDVIGVYVRILSKYSDLLVLKYNLWCAYSSDLLVLIYILWFWQEEMFELDRKQCLNLTGRNVLDVLGVYVRILSKYSETFYKEWKFDEAPGNFTWITL